MPGMDGLEATKEIRKFELKEKRNKSFICMLSAFHGEGDKN